MTPEQNPELIDLLNEMSGQIDEHFAAIHRRIDATERRLDAMAHSFATVDRQFSAVHRRFDIIDQQSEMQEGQIPSWRADLETLKAKSDRPTVDVGGLEDGRRVGSGQVCMVGIVSP